MLLSLLLGAESPPCELENAVGAEADMQSRMKMEYKSRDSKRPWQLLADTDLKQALPVTVNDMDNVQEEFWTILPYRTAFG